MLPTQMLVEQQQRPAPARRAYAYLRVSTDSQDEQKQRGVIESWAGGQSVEIVRWYADHGESAFRDDAQRPQFWQCVQDAEADQPFAVLVKDSSRWSRRREVAVTTKERLSRAGVQVIAVSEFVATGNRVSDLWLNAIHETRSQAESEINRMHTLDGMKAHVCQRDPKSGWAYKNGGRAPFGFVSVRVEDGRDRKGQVRYRQIWELDETVQVGRTNAEWRRQICQWRAESVGLKEIRNRLNEIGVLSVTGRPWSVSSVQALLEPHAVTAAAGHYVWNRGTKRQHRGRANLKSSEEWVVIEKAHPQIISDELAAQLIEISRSGVSMRARQNESPWILSGGIFTCGACGANMTSNKSKGYRYYLCGSYQYRGGVDCPGPRLALPADALEDEILRRCSDLYSFTDARLASLTAKLNKRAREHNSASAVRHYEAEIRRVNTELARLSEAIRAGITIEAVMEDSRKLQIERARLESAMHEAEAAQLEEITVEQLREVRDEIREIVRTGTPATKRALLARYLDGMTLDPKRQEIEMRYRTDNGVVIHVVAPRGVEPRFSD